MLHIPIVHGHDVSKQIPREKNFPSEWKCYKTIGSCISCAFVEIWSTWEVWRALKKLELLSATPPATLTHLSCSPNFPCASYLDERMLTYEPIGKYIQHVRYEWFRMRIMIISRNFPVGVHKGDFYHSSSKSENGVVYCLLQIYGRAVWKLCQGPHSPVLPF